MSSSAADEMMADRTYPNESLVGLIDPATGLKYHPITDAKE